MRIPISKNDRFTILNRDNHTCQYCGKKAPDAVLEIDHKVPVSKGGSNKHENLITSCFDCNRGKGCGEYKFADVGKYYDEKINSTCSVARLYFSEIGKPIKESLLNKIITDLVTQLDVSTSEIIAIIGSCKDPQDMVEICMDNFYETPGWEE